MQKLLALLASCIVLAACTGDDPTRNNEGPWEGRPLDSSPSARERSSEVTPDKQRAYATDDASEQTTAAPPDPDQ